MSFPPGTEMFQFPGFASPTYVFSERYPIGVGCPIRISTDQRLLAAPRGFSQRATSFIASWCQGIHRMPFSYSIHMRSPRDRSQEMRPTMHRNHPQKPPEAKTRPPGPNRDQPAKPNPGKSLRSFRHGGSLRSAHNRIPSRPIRHRKPANLSAADRRPDRTQTGTFTTRL
jgi:hypothetical protein